MVRGEVVAFLTAGGMVAGDDEEGVFVPGELSVVVDEPPQTVVGEEAGREQSGQFVAGLFQSGGASLVVFLQCLVRQA